MAKPIVKIFDAESGEEQEREMTDKEFSVYKATLERIEENQRNLENLAEANKSALEKLAALGLTEAEIKAISGQ